MAATSHSTRTNIINVQRLLDRLESPETASKPAASLTGLPADEEYYAVLGMISVSVEQAEAVRNIVY